MKVLQQIWMLKPIWMTIAAFIVPIKLTFGQSDALDIQGKCAYIIIVMALLWLTEAIPIPITSLMPVFLCPLLGVLPAKDVSSNYFTDTTMLFLGGLIIAVALEETGLHTRISLCVMMVVGAHPVFLMAGLMGTSFFLSMWISNTAATSMMLPIISAVVKTINKVLGKPKNKSNSTTHVNAAFEAADERVQNGTSATGGVSAAALKGALDAVGGTPLKEHSPAPGQRLRKLSITSSAASSRSRRERSGSRRFSIETSSMKGKDRRGSKWSVDIKDGAILENGYTLAGVNPLLVDCEYETRSRSGSRWSIDVTGGKILENGFTLAGPVIRTVVDSPVEEEPAEITVPIIGNHIADVVKVDVEKAESEIRSDIDDDEEIESPEIKRYAKAFAIAVAYGANIGGFATLTGSAPNLVLKEIVDELYAQHHYNGTASIISYANWLGFALPLAALTAVLCWIVLCIIFIRKGCCMRMSTEEKAIVNKTIKDKFKSLGFLSFAEIQVLVIFLLLVFLWLFRKPPSITGWGDLTVFKPGFLSDSSPCMLLCAILFILPKKVPKVFCCQDNSDEDEAYIPILTWQLVASKLPWGVIILLGGGFAMANASQTAGLSQLIGDGMATLDFLDSWVLNLVMSVMVAFATEVTSSTATATLLLPILAQLGITANIHPLYLMVSATVGCSTAFMLPVATPPNAIVFSTGHLVITDMVLAGLPMNIIALMTLTLAINTWAVSMWDLKNLPEIFRKPKVPQVIHNVTNATTVSSVLNTMLTNVTLTTAATTVFNVTLTTAATTMFNETLSTVATTMFNETLSTAAATPLNLSNSTTQF